MQPEIAPNARDGRRCFERDRFTSSYLRSESSAMSWASANCCSRVAMRSSSWYVRCSRLLRPLQLKNNDRMRERERGKYFLSCNRSFPVIVRHSARVTHRFVHQRHRGHSLVAYRSLSSAACEASSSFCVVCVRRSSVRSRSSSTNCKRR